MTETVATSIPTTALRLRVNEQGQVLIPVELVQALGVDPGDLVVARVRDGRLTIQSLRSREDEVWAMVAGNSGSLVDELFADRRVEVRRELTEVGVDEAEIERMERAWLEANRRDE
ncbi:MAG: AbrB/MazE/SpoVT family DNA-binding domain-containing protein [Chloroflexota bacterium]|nr:AbrB/MazE/SpoVT family DNA-binding domain-containing protein [Chloroflexota bacterium]